MDKIEVSQRAREAAFDAYLTCYETVPNDLWLQALLDGKHDGDEMAQAFARFDRDILATRTDATPVAWMPIESAPKDGTFIFAFFRATYESGQPDYFGVVKWGEDFEGWGDVGWLENRKLVGDPTLWQPLPAAPDATHPPATDVAALVEAATASAEGWANAVEFNLLPARHWQNANDLQRQLRQALAPFTKGTGDE